jgi:hypothetical protein
VCPAEAEAGSKKKKAGNTLEVPHKSSTKAGKKGKDKKKKKKKPPTPPPEEEEEPVIMWVSRSRRRL